MTRDRVDIISASVLTDFHESGVYDRVRSSFITVLALSPTLEIAAAISSLLFPSFLTPLLGYFVVRKIDSTSVGLRRSNLLRHGCLVVHEQGDQNDNRYRNSE